MGGQHVACVRGTVWRSVGFIENGILGVDLS